MGSGVDVKKSGSLPGTGAVIKIGLGFKPVKVELYNEDGLALAIKTDTMAGSSAIKQITAGTMTFPSGVCTLLDDGFQIEADADLNVADEVLHFVAWQKQNS